MGSSNYMKDKDKYKYGTLVDPIKDKDVVKAVNAYETYNTILPIRELRDLAFHQGQIAAMNGINPPLEEKIKGLLKQAKIEQLKEDIALSKKAYFLQDKTNFWFNEYVEALQEKLDGLASGLK